MVKNILYEEKENVISAESSWIFYREESGQFYIEYSYYIRKNDLIEGALKGKFMDSLAGNVATNMEKMVKLDSIILMINDKEKIVLTGSAVPNISNKFRFPVSLTITNQLLNCNSISLQAVGQGIHGVHQESSISPEGSRDIIDLKRFINYWNGGGMSVSVTSKNDEKKANTQIKERDEAKHVSISSANTNTLKEDAKINENQTSINQSREGINDGNRRLRYPAHPVNCCHNIFGK